MDQSIGDIRIDYVVSRIIVIDKKVRHCLYRYEIRMHRKWLGMWCGISCAEVIGRRCSDRLTD